MNETPKKDMVHLPITNTALNFDGERYLPGIGGEIELEHIHR